MKVDPDIQELQRESYQAQRDISPADPTRTVVRKDPMQRFWEWYAQELYKIEDEERNGNRTQ